MGDNLQSLDIRSLEYLWNWGGKYFDVKLALLNYIDYNVVTISGTSWFLPTMFLTELVFLIVVNVIGLRKVTFLFYLSIVSMGLLAITKNKMELPFALDVLPFSLGYFALGVLFQKEILHFKLSKVAFITLDGILVGCYWIDGLHCNIRTSSYHPIYIGWAACLFISLILILIVKHIEPYVQKVQCYSFIKEIGQNTLVIYLLHMEVLRILPLQKLGGDSLWQTTVIQIIVTVCVLYVMVVVSRNIRRYLPWSLGK